MNLDYLDMTDAERKMHIMFRKRNFWSGFSSVLSIFGEEEKFNTSILSKEEDFKALKSDWEMIGDDIRNSMSEIILEDCE